MASEYTANYNLDLYVNEDKPNLRDQYNAAMRKIDNALVADDAALSTIDGQIVTINQNYTTLNGIVGNSNSGLVKDVADLQTTVGDASSGLVKDVADNATAIGGLVNDVADLETTVGDANSGLVKDVADLETTVGNSTSGLVKDVNDLQTLVSSKKEVIVVLGDSWTDTSVQAAKWTNTLLNLFGGTDHCELHNYAVNGCHGSNSSFQAMYNAFLTDTSFDKSTITRVILVYGVNDYYTYGVSRSTAQSYISTMYSALYAQIPENVPIHWFINYAYGKDGYSMTDQINFWNTTMYNLAISCPKLIPHPMWSWFAYNELNTSTNNFFHLTEDANKGHLAINIFKCITGGNPIKYQTYAGVYNHTNTTINLQIDVDDHCVRHNIIYTLPSAATSVGPVSFSPAVVPVKLTNGIILATEGGYGNFLTGSYDGTNIDRVTFACSAGSSAIQGRTAELEFTLNVTGV